MHTSLERKQEKPTCTWKSAGTAAFGGADINDASAKRSTSVGALCVGSVGKDVGASMRSPIRLSPNRSTCLTLAGADSVKWYQYYTRLQL